MGLTADIRERIHDINSTITTRALTAEKYYPTNFDSWRIPFITPLLGAETKAVQIAGAEQFSGVRVWTLLMICGAWLEGQPSESAQETADDLIDAVTECYIARPRLEFDGQALRWVERAELGSDDGLFDYGGFAALRFPLAITARRSFTYNTAR